MLIEIRAEDAEVIRRALCTSASIFERPWRNSIADHLRLAQLQLHRAVLVRWQAAVSCKAAAGSIVCEHPAHADQGRMPENLQCPAKVAALAEGGGSAMEESLHAS